MLPPSYCHFVISVGSDSCSQSRTLSALTEAQGGPPPTRWAQRSPEDGFDQQSGMRWSKTRHITSPMDPWWKWMNISTYPIVFTMPWSQHRFCDVIVPSFSSYGWGMLGHARFWRDTHTSAISCEYDSLIVQSNLYFSKHYVTGWNTVGRRKFPAWLLHDTCCCLQLWFTQGLWIGGLS